MPPAPVDPARVRALSVALAQLRHAAGAGAEDLLRLYPEAGEPALQVGVDAFLEQAAGLLEAVEAAAAELGARLEVAAPAGIDPSLRVDR